MNFLSHFYFDRHNTNPDMVMGMILPDLVKNADKSWNFNPVKMEDLFPPVPGYQSLLQGWKRHLQVDSLFHSSVFFKEKTALLKQLLLPVLQSGPVKPFFLAHIGLELVLDHLLLTGMRTDTGMFYTQLERADKTVLLEFLALSGLPDAQRFEKFLTGFISSRYLFSYEKMENITYALNRICMRLWQNPLTEPQLQELTVQLELFKDLISTDYLSIFREIEPQLCNFNHS